MNKRHVSVRSARIVLLLVVAFLTTLLAAGCSADEPIETQSPPASLETTSSDMPDDDILTEEPTSAPTGELVDGATHSVAQVLDAPREGMQVVLGGNITLKVSAEDFMLDDGTGELFVDGDDDFGTLNVGDRLLVTGTVDVEDSPTRVEIQATGVQRR